MIYYVITEKGRAWLDKMSYLSAEDWDRVPLYVEEAFDILHTGQDEVIREEFSPSKSAFNHLLRHGYIKLDGRTTDELVRNIGRYDRDLGKFLKVYIDIAKQKQVRDVDLNEALLIGLEKLDGPRYVAQRDAAKSRLLHGLRSKEEGDKIAAIDHFVQLVHRSGLLWARDDEAPDPVALDLQIVLDRLAEE